MQPVYETVLRCWSIPPVVTAAIVLSAVVYLRGWWFLWRAGVPFLRPWKAVAFLSGLLIAPSLTALTLLVTRNAPARYATEAFTWMSTCVVSGIGAGTAVGGQLVEEAGPWAAFAVAAASCGLATLLSFTLRSRRLRS